MEDEVIRTMMQTAFDRIEKLTGTINKQRALMKSTEELAATLGSARALLAHIAENSGVDQMYVDSIRLELRKG